MLTRTISYCTSTGRGQEHRGARLEDARLGLGRRGPREPARPVGHRLSPPGPGEPLRGGLPARARLARRLGDARAGGDPAARQLSAARREPCVRMLGHGTAPFAASLNNSQHAGAIPISHPRGVNNVLALNS